MKREKNMDGVDFIDAPPTGFRLLVPHGKMVGHNGPFYIKDDEDPVVFGFRAKKIHANAANILHGGMMMTFADSVMGITARRQTGKGTVTVRFNSDFFSMVRPGEWVEGRARVTGQDGDFIFMAAKLSLGTRVVLRSSGIFKVLRGSERRKRVKSKAQA